MINCHQEAQNNKNNAHLRTAKNLKHLNSYKIKI